MKTVIALIAFSDGELSMFKGEIRDIDETKAEQLIDEGYVAEYSAGGGSGGGALVVHATSDGNTMTLDKTWDEIYTASATMPISIVWHNDDVNERFTQYLRVDRVTNNNAETGTRQYTVYAHIELESDNNSIAFIADSEDGYPSVTMG